MILIYKRMYRAICLLNNKRVRHLRGLFLPGPCCSCPENAASSTAPGLAHALFPPHLQVVEELFPVSKVGDMMGVAHDIRMQHIYAYSRYGHTFGSSLNAAPPCRATPDRNAFSFPPQITHLPHRRQQRDERRLAPVPGAGAILRGHQLLPQ